MTGLILLKDLFGNTVVSASDGSYHSAADFMRHVLKIKKNLHDANIQEMVRQWPDDRQSLANIDWSGVDLSGCDASNLDLSSGDFTHTIIRGAVLRSAILRKSIFAGTIMDGTCLERCDISGSLLTEVKQVGSTARHHLRPHADEFLPFDRLLARSADFTNAILDDCTIVHANFTAAIFEGASIKRTVIEKCNMEGAVFTGADFSDSHVYRSDLVSATICLSICTNAVFRSNEYIEVPVPKTIADASFSFPRQVIGYFRAEIDHWKSMPRELRIDYKRVIMIKLMVFASVPAMVVLAWKYVETNALMSLITAMGAISTLAMRRYVIMLMQAIVGFVLGKINDAEGLWKKGFRRKAISSIVMPGLISNRIAAIKRTEAK
jgi:uncharacterized protein YjbI with pentapeptide repeats